MGLSGSACAYPTYSLCPSRTVLAEIQGRCFYEREKRQKTLESPHPGPLPQGAREFRALHTEDDGKCGEHSECA